VPLVQAAINRDMTFISLKTWVACIVALMGVAVIGLDGQDMSTVQSSLSVSSLVNLSQGDWLIVAAAFSYTFHRIRLERFAKETSAINLAAAKATTEMALCLSLVICLLIIADISSGVVDGPLGSVVNSGQEIADYFTLMTQAWSEGSIPVQSLYPAIMAVLWTGLVTVAYTITAQSFGQSKVDPITANLIYTIQPLCTAIFAFGLLGETLGPTGYFGGALIASAVYLVAVE
jgi:drug/metabolite transporter (DMT)-like permease